MFLSLTNVKSPPMAVLDEIEFPWKAIELLSPGWIEWKPILETTSWDLNNDRKLFLWFQCEGCLSICTCVPAVCDVWPHTYRDVNVHDRLSYFYFPNRKDIGREIARRRRWGVVRPILRVYVQQQLREEGKERKKERRKKRKRRKSCCCVRKRRRRPAGRNRPKWG